MTLIEVSESSNTSTTRINWLLERNKMDTINQATVADKGLETTDRSYWVDLAEALERLERNDDFKKVILDGYFKDKAVMGVSLLATDQVKRAGARTDVMEGLIAISALEDHFHVIRSMGKIAQDDMDESEE